MGWAVPDTESLRIRTSHKVMQYVLQSHILWSKSNILFLVDGFLHNFSLPLPPHTPYNYDKTWDLGSCTNLCSPDQRFLFNLLSNPASARAAVPGNSGEALQSLQAQLEKGMKGGRGKKKNNNLIHSKPPVGNSRILMGSEEVIHDRMGYARHKYNHSVLEGRRYKFQFLDLILP